MAQVARTSSSRERMARPVASNGASNGQAIAPEALAAPSSGATSLNVASAVEPPSQPDAAQRELTRLRLEREQMQAERAEALQAKAELAALLEERARRAQQLLGERAQLETRLRERDEQIQRLNRELGAATRPPPTAAPPPPGKARLGALLAGLLGRLHARPQPAGKIATASLATPSLVPAPAASLQPFIKDGEARPLIVAIVLGLGRDELPVVLKMVERYCRDRKLLPVLLTDHDGLDLFRSRRMLFEYLPPPAVRDRFAPGLDWDLYVQRRLALIRRKWQPARIIAFGPTAAQTARSWRTSPFEDQGIEALLGSGESGEPLGGSPQEVDGAFGYGATVGRKAREPCQNS
jgi:hypothetical protein